MPFTFIKNGCQYTITVKRVPYENVKNDVDTHKKYVTFLSKKKDILTKDKQKESLAILNDFKKHSSHATLHVSQLNLQTHKISEYNFAITSKPNVVTIKPSLSEAMLGETAKSYGVIEFEKGLYITSHSIDNRLHLKSEELRYDEDKNCYIEMATNEPYYITKENLEEMSFFLVNKIESKNVEKIDITSKGDFKNDIVSYKMLEMLKTGTLDNKSHPEIDTAFTIVNEEYTQYEIEFCNKNAVRFDE